ncbi:MAG: nitrilase-related carbon-nitrogen hydrolase [Candidatus Margulisiibacteriota bacterium]
MNFTQITALCGRGRYRVVAAQVENVIARRKSEQIELAQRHIQAIAPLRGKIDLAVFPELSTVGLGPINNYIAECVPRLAEGLNGEVGELFRQAAQSLDCAIGFGLIRLIRVADRDQYLNSFIIVDPQGNMTVTDKSRDYSAPEPNPNALKSFTLGELKVGVTICRDLFHPLTYRGIMRMKPDLIVCPQFSFPARNLTYHVRKYRADLLAVNFAEAGAGGSAFLNYWPGSDPVAARVDVHSLSELGEEALVAVI